jgi:hypothetical protein
MTQTLRTVIAVAAGSTWADIDVWLETVVRGSRH